MYKMQELIAPCVIQTYANKRGEGLRRIELFLHGTRRSRATLVDELLLLLVLELLVDLRAPGGLVAVCARGVSRFGVGGLLLALLLLLVGLLLGRERVGDRALVLGVLNVVAVLLALLEPGGRGLLRRGRVALVAVAGVGLVPGACVETAGRWVELKVGLRCKAEGWVGFMVVKGGRKKKQGGWLA